MANHLSLGFLLLALVTLSASVQQGYKEYPASYDDTDVNGILNNRNLRDSYVDCFMDRGTCSPEGQTMKDIIPMAVSDRCAKCKPKQMRIYKQVREHFKTSRVPGDWQMWAEVEAKYNITPYLPSPIPSDLQHTPIRNSSEKYYE